MPERPTHTGSSSSPAPTDTGPSPLTCPVSRCPSVFEGVTSHLDFCRHLKCPDLCGREGYEKVAWLNLHRREHERYMVTDADEVGIVKLAEHNKADEEGKQRASKLDLSTGNMERTRERHVPQEAVTCEGMCARAQMSVQYYAGILLGAAVGVNK
ncbi:hypothetical protein HOY82DRAFT_629413 [Tuber indicum]|nr:hypothetical protein HOY82DRAFT_629413 [Tuber indicum]